MAGSRPFKKYDFSLTLHKELIRFMFCILNPEGATRLEMNAPVYLYRDFWISPSRRFFFQRPIPLTPFMKFQKSSFVTPTKNSSLLFDQNFVMQFFFNLPFSLSFRSSSKKMENKKHPNSTTALNNSNERNRECVSPLRLLYPRSLGGPVLLLLRHQ